MAEKLSPGPWVLTGEDGEIRAANGDLVCRRAGWDNPADGPALAAAPHMLSALKAIRETYRGCEHLLGATVAAKIRAIDEAIAAAEPEGKS